MAKLLEDLAHHFGQMETALNEHEAGDVVGEEDMESNVAFFGQWCNAHIIRLVFIRDTAELPSIIAEMEESLRLIEDFRWIWFTTLNGANFWTASNSQKEKPHMNDSLTCIDLRYHLWKNWANPWVICLSIRGTSRYAGLPIPSFVLYNNVYPRSK